MSLPASSSSPPSIRSSVPRPSFVIGITGNMDPDFEALPESVLIERLETILLFIRYGARCRDPRVSANEVPSPTFGDAFRALLPPDTEACRNQRIGRCFDACRCERRQIEFCGLEDWPGLAEHTELVLLSSLAPGADTLVVNTLLKLNREPLFSGKYPNGLPAFHGRVRAPLPFPEDLYQRASTFKTDAERRIFRDLVADLPNEDVFPVLEERDFRSADESSLPAPDFAAEVEDSTMRRRRYQAAGEYVATFSDLLIALYDDRFHSGSSAGSNEIVEAKRFGATPGLLPVTRAISWADNGPVFHLYQPRLKTRKAKDAGKVDDEGARSLTPLRILHTYDLGPKDEQTRARLRDVWGIRASARQFGADSTEASTVTGSDRQAVDATATDDGDDLFTGEPAYLLREYAHWQATGNTMISEIASNLNEFSERPASSSSEDRAIYSLCGQKVKDGQRKDRDLDELKDEMKTRLANSEPAREHIGLLEPLARIRRRAANAVYDLDPIAKGTLLRLIRITFFAAIALHLFSHFHSLNSKPWYPSFQEETTALPADTSHAGSADRPHHPAPVAAATHAPKDEGGHPLPHPHWPNFFLGWLAFLLALGGLEIFRRFMASQVEERRFDTRALAEGIRVQFYWGLAGLRRTVAANYMQRVRSEMDWVRNAISSMTMPSERFHKSFLALRRVDQLRLLKLTVQAWIRPPMRTPDDLGIDACDKDRQQDYFWTSKHEQSERLHLFHQSGSAIAVAGMLHIIPLSLFVAFPIWMMELRQQPVIIAFIFLAGFLLLTVSIGIGDRCHEIHHRHVRQRKPFRSLNYRKASAIFHDLFSHRTSPREQTNRKARAREALINFAFTLIPASGLLLISISISLAASKASASLPSPLDTGIILMGICLVGGALLVAYAERQLLSEHARQYNAAHEFFVSARLRLERHLDELHEALLKCSVPIRFLDERVDAWKKRQAAKLDLPEHQVGEPSKKELEAMLKNIRDGGERGFSSARESIHRLLFALGKEALDENSEWLILHRSRPMEPVMAG